MKKYIFPLSCLKSMHAVEQSIFTYEKFSMHIIIREAFKKKFSGTEKCLKPNMCADVV